MVLFRYVTGSKRQGEVLRQTNAAPALRRAFGRMPDWHNWHEVAVRSVPVPVFIRVDLRPDSGQIVCTGLVIGVAPPGAVVRAADLRLPLAQVLTEMDHTLKSLGGAGTVDWSEIAVPPAALIRPGRKGRGDAFYRDLTARYRSAMQVQPAAPTKFLLGGDYKGVPDSRLRYWLNEARRRGILGKSEKGKAGEVRTTPRRKRT